MDRANVRNENRSNATIVSGVRMIAEIQGVIRSMTVKSVVHSEADGETNRAKARCADLGRTALNENRTERRENLIVRTSVQRGNRAGRKNDPRENRFSQRETLIV